MKNLYILFSNPFIMIIIKRTKSIQTLYFYTHKQILCSKIFQKNIKKISGKVRHYRKPHVSNQIAFTIKNAAINTYRKAHQATRIIKLNPLHLIYIIKNILSSSMQKSFLHYYEQQLMYLCTYYPIYNYFAPFSYAQHGSIQNFNLNLVNHDRNTELNTNASIETLALTEPKKVSKEVHIAVLKRNKRRHHRNKSKLIQSAKKNCQSNIINHILSFLMKQKEKQSILDRAITRLNKTHEQREKIKYHFQEVLRIVNLKRQRKYINRKTVLCLFTSESLRKQLTHQAQKMEESDLINLDELCYLYRICVMYYMRNLSQIGIMTSKRIQNLAKKIHLRRRSLLQSIFLKEDSKFQPIPSEE